MCVCAKEKEDGFAGEIVELHVVNKMVMISYHCIIYSLKIKVK